MADQSTILRRVAQLAIFGLVLVLAACQKQAANEAQSSKTEDKDTSLLSQLISKPTYDVPAGTRIRVRLDQSLDTDSNAAGDTFTASLESPVTAGGKTVLPMGTRFAGRVVSAQSSGRLKGRGHLTISLASFELRGKSYDVVTSPTTRVTGDHKKRNAALIGGGTGVGALIGGIAGGGKGAAIGAAAGAAAGTGGAAATGKKDVVLPAETVLNFTLKAAVRVEG